jgi:hypothetical protein
LLRLLRWLGDAASAIMGNTELNDIRRDVIQRAATATVIIAILPIQQMRVPGWPAVIAACATALAYDIPLAYLVFVKKRAFLARTIGFCLDSIVLMWASLVVLRQMGAGNSESDIWLVFLVYVVSGGFTLAPFGSLLYTALWIGWFALGTLLYYPAGSQYYEQLPVRMVFMALIGLIALAMANELQKRRAKLVQQNRQSIGMLATLVEARDADVGSHLHRIQHFSRALALRLGSTPREAQEIAYASMIHDVGKANVPDAILQKAGPLSPQEWLTMQDHTRWGDHLLTDNSDFELARQVARSHHEHWDGSGYPDGLAGEQIPRTARIVAVADVFDALISKRPYKEAWDPETAIRELQRMAGSHLDPKIVAAFVQLWEEGAIARITQEIDQQLPAEAPLERAA